MKNIANKKFKQGLDELFVMIKKNKIYIKLKTLPSSVRIIIFVLCVVRFLIATIALPPIPLGNTFLIFGLIILFPPDQVKSKLYYIVNKLRLKWLYAKWLSRRQKRSQKTTSKTH